MLDSMVGNGTSCYDSSNLNLSSMSSTLSFVVNIDEEEWSINNIDTNTLIKKISKYDIEKLLIDEAPIEDIFLHYYK